MELTNEQKINATFICSLLTLVGVAFIVITKFNK